MVTIEEIVEDAEIGEVVAGHTGNAVGVFGPSACSHIADPAGLSSSTGRARMQAVSLVTAERLGGLASQDKGQGPSAFDTCSDTHVMDDDKDDGGPDHVLSVKYGGDDEAPVIQQHQQAPAPVIQQHQQAPAPVVQQHQQAPAPVIQQHQEAPAPVVQAPAPVVQQHQQAPEILQQAPEILQEDDGFTLVRSRKFGWVRKRFPEGPYVAPAEPLLEREVMWLPKATGRMSSTRKWAQTRHGQYFGTPDGPSSIIYDSSDPDSIEY